MNLNIFIEILSSIVELPASVVVVILVTTFIFLSGLGIGIGLALKDIPMHLSQTIIATYNFVLLLAKRDPIKYPAQNCFLKNTRKGTSTGTKSKKASHKD